MGYEVSGTFGQAGELDWGEPVEKADDPKQDAEAPAATQPSTPPAAPQAPAATPAPQAPPPVDVYDGDTPKGEREGIRARAQLLITNPDMLHVSILPFHSSFRRRVPRPATCTYLSDCTISLCIDPHPSDC